MEIYVYIHIFIYDFLKYTIYISEILIVMHMCVSVTLYCIYLHSWHTPAIIYIIYSHDIYF